MLRKYIQHPLYPREYSIFPGKGLRQPFIGTSKERNSYHLEPDRAWPSKDFQRRDKEKDCQVRRQVHQNFAKHL